MKFHLGTQVHRPGTGEGVIFFAALRLKRSWLAVRVGAWQDIHDLGPVGCNSPFMVFLSALRVLCGKSAFQALLPHG